MIITSYASFRTIFAGPGAGVDRDGLPEWPAGTLYRRPGFSKIITTSAIDLIPTTFTCNGGAFDAVEDVDEYDWYVSQRTPDPTRQPFVVEPYEGAGSKSGTIVLSLRDPTLEIDPSTPYALRRWWRNVDVYVRRRSDGYIDSRLMYTRIVNEVLIPVDDWEVAFGKGRHYPGLDVRTVT